MTIKAPQKCEYFPELDCDYDVIQYDHCCIERTCPRCPLCVAHADTPAIDNAIDPPLVAKGG